MDICKFILEKECIEEEVEFFYRLVWVRRRIILLFLEEDVDFMEDVFYWLFVESKEEGNIIVVEVEIGKLVFRKRIFLIDLSFLNYGKREKKCNGVKYVFGVKSKF